MTRKTVRTAIVSSLGVLALAALVVAEQPPAGQQQSLNDMMKECRTHCQATTTSIDQLTKQMEEAKQSNDPGQMRAALDEAQKPLAKMKDHMTGCRNMMGMMEHMHGSRGRHMTGEGSHMGGMMHEEGSKSGAESR